MAAIAGVDVEDVGKKVYDKLLESTFQTAVASKAAADVVELRPVHEGSKHFRNHCRH